MTDQQKQRIVQMRAEGKQYKEIAEGMGLNAKKILYYDVVGKENDEIHQ